jgi:type I restriction enzyme S subunit
MSFGRPYIMKTSGCIHDGWLVLSPKNGVADPDYFYHLLGSDILFAEFDRRAAGATVKNLNIDLVKGVEVPLPPLAEQKRIAEVLDKAEELRAKRRAALAQLNTLTQSIFLEIFGDPIENERRWNAVQVRDFVAGFESGKSLVADDEDSQESRYRVLKVSAVTSLRFRSDESKALPADYIPPHSHIVRKGDLLFSRANTADLIGATVFVEEDAANLVLPDKIWRFVWHTPRNANPSFVRFLFQHPKFRHEIGKRATGTSGSMKNISQEKVLGISCALPPMELQEKFSERATAIEKLKVIQQASLAELDNLFASLQQRAFQGSLL